MLPDPRNVHIFSHEVSKFTLYQTSKRMKISHVQAKGPDNLTTGVRNTGKEHISGIFHPRSFLPQPASPFVSLSPQAVSHVLACCAIFPGFQRLNCLFNCHFCRVCIGLYAVTGASQSHNPLSNSEGHLYFTT
jgi:hypothetical protein